MKNVLKSILLIVFFQSSGYAQTSRIAVNLKCEYNTDPLGVDLQNPRLSWQIKDTSRGATQTAYQVWVSTDSIQLLKGKADAWNPGKVNTGQTNAVEYKGITLASRKKYYWRVMVWDKDRKPSPPSVIASLETGIYSLPEWKGEWINDSMDLDYKPAPYFRKTFTTNPKIKKARAYICGLGYYELSINGKKVGDHVLDPAYTRFDKTAFYLTYDITAYLNQGENAVGVLLGNGWCNEQSKAVWFFDKAPWRERPKLLLNIYIEYENGKTDLIVSDHSWKTSASPIIFNNIYSGEYYDARREQKGWNEPGFNDSAWKPANPCMPQAGKLVAQLMPPIRVTRELKPVSMKKTADQTYVFDLGQNFAGLSRLQVSGERGTTIYIKHGEDLSAQEGTRLNQHNISEHYRFEDSTEAAQTDRFILKGEGLEEFAQHFTYHGYRYVEISSDKPIVLTQNSLTGLVIHTDARPIGSFSCSDTLLNKIYTAGIWSYISNMQSIPTDCPHREKNGWTGDGQISAEIGLYNFDAILFYEKWIGDFIDAQRESGEVPGIVPSSGWGYAWGNGPVWDAALILVPWYIYAYYGDDHLIKKYYEHYKRYVDYLSFRADSNKIQHIGLGDWSPYKTTTPVELTSTLYYYLDVLTLSRFAKITGNNKDELYYAALAEKIKSVINDKLFDKAKQIYGNGSQTALSSALFMGIVPDQYKNEVLANLVKEVEKNDNHLDVGMIGSKTLLNALTNNGRTDLAYLVASQKTRPSWGWWLEQGETTLQEGWGLGPSRNHIFLGEIVAWFFKAIAGINVDPSQPGYKNIIIKPNFVDSLSYAKASVETVHGTIASAWQRSANAIQLDLAIPPCSTATLYLSVKTGQKVYEGNKLVGKDNPWIKYVYSREGIARYEIKAGKYEFKIK